MNNSTCAHNCHDIASLGFRGLGFRGLGYLNVRGDLWRTGSRNECSNEHSKVFGTGVTGYIRHWSSSRPSNVEL